MLVEMRPRSEILRLVCEPCVALLEDRARWVVDEFARVLDLLADVVKRSEDDLALDAIEEFECLRSFRSIEQQSDAFVRMLCNKCRQHRDRVAVEQRHVTLLRDAIVFVCARTDLDAER